MTDQSPPPPPPDWQQPVPPLPPGSVQQAHAFASGPAGATPWETPRARTSGLALVVTGVLAFFGGVIVTVVTIVLLGFVFGGALAGFLQAASVGTFSQDFGGDFSESYGDGLYSVTVGPGGDVTTLTTAVGTCLTGEVDTNDYKAKTIGNAVDCAEPHTYETYFTGTIPLDEFAGYEQSSIDMFADALCALNFTPYTGESFDDSDLSYFATIPSERAWTSGVRDVTCQVFEYDGNTLNRSVRDSLR